MNLKYNDGKKNKLFAIEGEPSSDEEMFSETESDEEAPKCSHAIM